MTKSRTTEAYGRIELLRWIYNVSKSNTLVDQDGNGWWVIDDSVDADGGIYMWFSGWAWCLQDPKTGIIENYANLKTQCAYRISERVNAWKIAISDAVIYVDWEACSEVMIDGKMVEVRKLIAQDLRSFKKKDPDREGKKQMIPKLEQKNILKRSPDFGDAFIEREWFEFQEIQNNTEVFVFKM